MHVTAPPHLTGDYQRVHVAWVGTTVRLVCPVVAHPPALVDWWWKDRHRIHDGWVRHRPINGTLRVRDVRLSDSGRYTCEATNGFGSAQATFFLHVYGLGYSTHFHLCSLTSPARGHWGTCPLDFQLFNFSGHFRAAQTLTFNSMWLPIQKKICSFVAVYCMNFHNIFVCLA